MRACLVWIILCLASPAFSADHPARNVRLTFVGDIMTHPRIFQAADYAGLYQGVADVMRSSDLTFANLEFPVDPTRPESGYPLFNGHRDYVRAAVKAGIRVFSTANNHAFDGHEEGVFQTIRTLMSLRSEDSGLLFFSGTRGNEKSPFVPVTIVVRGVRIGFIAVTQFLNEPGGGGRFVHVVDFMNRDESDAFVSFVKEASPFFDLFIVSYHGDQEYVQDAAPARRSFFHRLVESGAQIVFGHHPHVLQDYEIVNVRGGRRLIMYSMGNFISGMNLGDTPPDPDSLIALTGDSIMLTAEVRVDSAGTEISSVTPVMVGNYRKGTGDTVVAKLDELAGGSLDIPAAWSGYFAARRLRIQKFLAARTGGDAQLPQVAAR